MVSNLKSSLIFLRHKLSDIAISLEPFDKQWVIYFGRYLSLWSVAVVHVGAILQIHHGQPTLEAPNESEQAAKVRRQRSEVRGREWLSKYETIYFTVNIGCCFDGGFYALENLYLQTNKLKCNGGKTKKNCLRWNTQEAYTTEFYGSALDMPVPQESSGDNQIKNPKCTRINICILKFLGAHLAKSTVWVSKREIDTFKTEALFVKKDLRWYTGRKKHSFGRNWKCNDTRSQKKMYSKNCGSVAS